MYSSGLVHWFSSCLPAAQSYGDGPLNLKTMPLVSQDAELPKAGRRYLTLLKFRIWITGFIFLRRKTIIKCKLYTQRWFSVCQKKKCFPLSLPPFYRWRNWGRKESNDMTTDSRKTIVRARVPPNLSCVFIWCLKGLH